MMVAEYHQKFGSLCLHIDHSSDMEKMVEFFFGSRAYFQDVLSAFNFLSYKEVIETTYRRDSVLMQPGRDTFFICSGRSSFSSDKGKKRSAIGNWGKNKKGKSSSESSGGLYSNDGGSSTGSFSGPCLVYGQQGHIGRTCPNSPRVHHGGRSGGECSSTSRGADGGYSGSQGLSELGRSSGRSSHSVN